MKALLTTHVPMWIADRLEIPRATLRNDITRLDTHITRSENATGQPRKPQAWANDDYATLLRERDLLIIRDYRATHGATRGPAMTATERERLAWLEAELWQRACEEAGR